MHRKQASALALSLLLLAVGLTPGCGRRAAPGSAAPADRTAEGWEPLFDGRSLAGWTPSGFEGEGVVRVVDPFHDGRSAIVIEPGMTLSGVTSTRGSALPRTNYEITLEAMRLAGGDFFCGLTFPVGSAACTLVVGGWGGEVVGISSIDRLDASENETTREMSFIDQRWYRIAVRVSDQRIEAWIDDAKIVDVSTQGRNISLRPGDIQKAQPLGVATYMTRAAIRDIRLRRLVRRESPHPSPL